VRFATLVHDLGKGVTPEAEWPSHRGHEAAGDGLVKAMARRLKLPRDYERLGRMTARWHLHAHRALELRPATVLKMLSACDAFRRPEDFQRMLLACEADARGRTGLEDRPYPQAEFLSQCQAVASAITGKDVDGQRYQGKAFGEALDRLRQQAIADCIQTWKGEDND